MSDDFRKKHSFQLAQEGVNIQFCYIRGCLHIRDVDSAPDTTEDAAFCTQNTVL